MRWGGQEVGLRGKNRILEICIIRWSHDLMAAILDFSFFIKSVKKKLFLQEILMGYCFFHWILMKIYKMNKNINSLDYFYSFIQKKDRNVCKIPES